MLARRESLAASRYTLTASPVAVDEVPPVVGRYSDRDRGGNRAFGLGISLLIHIIVVGALLVTWRTAFDVAPPAAPIVVDLLPLSSPPATPPKEKEAPKRAERQETPPKPPPPSPVERTKTPNAPAAAAPVASPAPPPPAPRQVEAAAPRTLPAPPAPQVSSNAPDSWQGRVLAQLSRYRRYPHEAQARRQQGVPYIRFVIDREGRVLSTVLERSSGYSALDREAVSLPKRAQPLPKPPADVAGDTVELVVPVEFFLR